MVGGPITAFFGHILEGEFKGNYGWTWFHWWYAPIVMLPVISYLAYRGVEISTRVIVILGALEMIIVLALAVWGIFDPGKGGFNVSSFNPGNVANWSTFSLAVVFSIQGFTGWDGAAPLAEETAEPRRNVPRAVIGSILILGAFLVIVSWGITLGWGTSVISSLPGSPELPGLVLAHHFWSRGWVLVLFAIFSSVMAVSLSSNNVSTRMWYSMARSGALPKALARLHPAYRTPVNAIAVQFVLNVVSGLVIGLWLGPAKGFNLLTGLTLVLAVLVVYTMANLGVFLFYRRERPQEFSWFKHAFDPGRVDGVPRLPAVQVVQSVAGVPVRVRADHHRHLAAARRRRALPDEGDRTRGLGAARRRERRRRGVARRSRARNAARLMASASGRIQGKRAIITGAGSGMGRAAARRFHAEGASVALIDLDAPALDALVAELEGGDAVLALPADVRDEAAIEAAVGRAVEAFGGLDIVVGNAGVQLAGQDDRADRLSLEVWQRTVDINLTGMFLICKHGIRALLANGGGAVVCTASPTGQYGCAAGYDAYSSSKAGVYGLIRVMAADYAPSIRINGVIPGYSDTAMTSWVTPSDKEALLKTIPMGRAGTAEEVAAVMLFLASDEASYVTGAVWAADGGMTAI